MIPGRKRRENAAWFMLL